MHRPRRDRPPHWWPEGERWSPPPAGGPSWTAVRRRAARAFVFGIGVVLVAPLVVALGLTARFGGWTSVGVVIVFWVMLIVVGAVIARGLARSFGPVRNIIETTDRLADGDYAARVAADRPTPLQPVLQSVNAMAERLERSERLRTRLLADVSHELRTPLTVIRGSLEAMADGIRPVDESGVRSLLGDVAVMERLLDDLRTLSAAEAGRLQLHTEPVDLALLAAEVVAGFEAGAGDRRLTVEATAVDEIEADPIRLRQVVANLVANAVRATLPDGEIRVEVREEARGPGDGEWVVLRVVDDGGGMTADDREHAFDRFHKGPESRGSGLGLAISRDLVEAHGGRIDLGSQLGDGTTVTVRLPVARD